MTFSMPSVMSVKKRGKIRPAGIGFLKCCWGFMPNHFIVQNSCSTFESRRYANIFFERIELEIIIIEKAKAAMRFIQSAFSAKENPITIVRTKIAARMWDSSSFIFLMREGFI